MKLNLLIVTVLFFLGLNSNAQLANWSTGLNSSFTNFPAFASDQINGSCRISQLKFHATDPNKMYVVTGEGGFFATLDGGNNWTVKAGTENLAGGCASLCIDYTNDQIIYLGTGDANYYSSGQGIYKSIDGGVTFTPTTLTNCLVIEILQDPNNAGTFVAATNIGIYKSTNNGVTWTATTATNIEFVDLKQNANLNSKTLYATTRENSARFFRSIDFGNTWTQITSGIVTATTNIQSGARIAVTPADTNIVYFSAIGGLGIIHKSIDGGLTFNVQKAEGLPNLTGYDTTLVSGGGQGNYNNCLTVDRLNPSKLWYQSHNTWKSSSSGISWTFLYKWSQMIHTDAHQIQQSPFDPTKLFAVNDGGVWLSTDEGTTWSPKSNGLYAYEVGSETGKSSHTNRNLLVIGTQDNGKLYRDGNSFVTLQGGDDYDKKEFDYLPNGGYYYNLGGNTRTPAPGSRTYLTYGLPAAVGSVEAIAFNRTNTDLGFVGKYNIYRTTNLSSSSPTWTQISVFAKPIMAIHSCIADINKLYVITNDQKMYVCSNAMSATPTFTILTLPSATNSLSSIAAIANNANTVYISINASVYISSNSGATWTNITYNLPNVNHRRILAEEYGGTQELVFIATNNAVYYKKSGQTSWTNYSTNLPGRRAPTSFSMYDNGTNQSLIRYASFGRGIWESPFDNLRPFSAQIFLNDDSTITCTNPSLLFEDGSLGKSNGPFAYSWSFPGGSPSSSTLASQNVTYPVTGNYTITLTITDALNNTSTQTINKFIQVISCSADTVPGSAISIKGTTNYATTPTIALGTTNTVTLCAWIKIDVLQTSFAGIIFSANGGATGLNFRNNNQLGYHYNELSSTYNYSGGPTVPMGEWVHIALVTTATNTTIYMNGVPYVNAIANSPINFSNGFNLGNDRNNSGRTMTGLMDEVCIYNRSLSQNEIRELMHLTKNYLVNEPNLKAYYQCNEVGGLIYDRAGNSNATLLGSASHVISTSPVGSGNSERQSITTNGVKTFLNEGITLNFGAGTLPSGEICVTRLNLQPDAVPSGMLSSNAAAKYWIINNYGSNSTFTSLVNITATGFGNISAADATTPNKFKLYNRNTGAFNYTSWNLKDSANSATSGTSGVLSFNTISNTSFNKQFTIVRSSPANYSINASAGANGTITPAGVTTLSAGANQIYSISPSSCYQIADVLVDGISVGAISNYTFSNITANHTISVSFILPSHTITASAGFNGTISPSGVSSFTCGGNQTYTFTPNQCSQISNVIVDGISVGAISTYSFTNIVGAHTITALFTQTTPCASDTIPGTALSINGTTNYANTPTIPLGTTNTITICAWIKIDAIQTSSAGIIFSSNGGATGINFKNNNQLGYHYKDGSATYGFSGGPTVPMGQWVHIALVTTANDATLYMNGVGYVNNVANVAINFTDGFNFGNDRGTTTRTMTGLLDEICIYNRSLSQSEIRELMHLSKNYPTVDPSLKAYYQCNELNGILIDRASGANGVLNGTASIVTSTVPVGSGKSERQTITTNGIKSFTNEGIDLTFGSGTLPQGEICVTRLNLQPSGIPTSSNISVISAKYWIINNYGSNDKFTALTNINATGFGNISIAEATQPHKYKLLSRGTGDFVNSSWSEIQNATSATANANGVLGFTGSILNSFNKQFTITKIVADAGPDVTICNGSSTAIGALNDINLTYNWSPSTGLSSTTINNPIASPSVTTTYILTTTNISNGSTSTDMVTVTVLPSLTSLSVSTTPPSANFCTGGSVSLTASSGLISSFVILGNGALVTVGNQSISTLGPNPLQNWFGGSKQLMLFTVSELNSLGLLGGAQLSGFGVNLAAANTAYALQNLQVKIQHTTLTGLTNFINTGWSIVRTAANFTPTGTSWNMIPFNTNFTWDGNSNLLVEVTYSNTNAGSSGNTALYGPTSNISTLFYRVDNVAAATIDTYSGAPTESYFSRNNVRFSLASMSSTFSWLPVTGLNNATGSTVIATPSLTTTYLVTAVTPGTCPVSTTKTITLSSYSIVASVGANGSISPSGTTIVNCGLNQTYTITPSSCYQIATVLIDGVNNPAAVSSGTFTFNNVTSVHTISATFTQISNSFSVAPTGILGTTTICNGTNTSLTVTGGNSGLGGIAQWFTGTCGGPSAGIGNTILVAPTTTQTYYVRYSGTCNTTVCTSTLLTVNNCILTLNLKAFLQGFYVSANTMRPALFNSGISTNVLECDSIIVELRDPLNLNTVAYSRTAVIKTDGTATMQFPGAVNNNSYYIVLRHRNSLETWSKNTKLFTGSSVMMDFTTP